MACDVDFGVQMKVHLCVCVFHGFAPATNRSILRLLKLRPMAIDLERFDKAFRDVVRKNDA